MAKGFDWSRAKARRPSLSIKDEKDHEPYSRAFIRRVGPKLSKEQWRGEAAQAVRDFERQRAARAAAQLEVKPPWEE